MDNPAAPEGDAQLPEAWDRLDDAACCDAPSQADAVMAVPHGADGGLPGLEVPRSSAFSLEDSAIEFFDLSDDERATVAAAPARSAFHPILPVALPQGVDDGGVSQEPPASDFAETLRQMKGKVAAGIRDHMPLAACLAAAVVAVGGASIGYSAGIGAAAGEDASAKAIIQVDTDAVSADRQLRDANIAARYEALGVNAASADRIASDAASPVTVYPVAVEATAEVQRIAEVDVSPGTATVLDVPLVNQLDDSGGGRSLMAGCEVASLAMVLRYSGIDVTKEELQDAMPTVPLVGEDGLNGNPNAAFVGEMAGGVHHAGYSVYHAPVADLAQRYLANRSFKAFDLTGQSFTTMLQEVASGNPCWIIITTSMAPDLILETWNTAEGQVNINWALHSVVVTGFDDEHVFINDPYGYEQNIPYDRTAFEEAWKLMGSQCVTVVPIG